MRSVVTFLYLMLVLCSAGVAQKQYQFQRINVRHGLSHNMVHDFVKDTKGFMWFATSSGLNRYDGYTIKVFRNIPGDTTSLLTNEVRRMFEGPDENIWINSSSGNNVYNPRTENFHRNTDALLRKYGVSNGLVTLVKKDTKGNFWFMHYNQGLFYYKTREEKTIRLVHDPANAESIASMDMASLSEDPDGNFWLIHKNGIFEKLDGRSFKVTYRNQALHKRYKKDLYEYSIMNDSDGDAWIFTNSNLGCFYFNKNDQTIRDVNSTSKIRLNSNIVRSVVEDNQGLIWVATDHGGVTVIDKKNDFNVQYVVHDEFDEKTLSENSINAMYKDNEGIIWIGTFKNGVSYYHENIFRFQLFRHYTSQPESLPFNDVNTFAEDRDGNLWIGTNGGGLIHYNRKTNRFKQYLHKPSDPNSPSTNVIVSLKVDHEGVLWIGTYYGGLNRFDGKRFSHFKHTSDPKSLGDDSVWEILEDSNKNLWIGTLRGGADVFNRSRGEFTHYRSGDFNSIHTNYVPALLEDKEGNIWLGTGYGIEFLERSTGRFVHYLNRQDDPTSVSNNSILSLLQDSRGMIWVGTQDGLNLFDPATKTFRTFRELQGLPSNQVITIVEDNDQNLWMSTPNGLSKLVIDRDDNGNMTFVFKNYDESDGLQGKAFNENAMLKLSTGALVCGGSQGFNIFHPNAIGTNAALPKVVLTDFQVFNKSIGIGEALNNNVILDQSISDISKITLKPANNIFSIEFAALNFFHPDKSQYRYKLEGFNKEWLTTDARQRRVTFTNLDPGEYVFKVRASNSDGLWSEEETTVKILALPPFWKSPIAFVLYAIFILGALLLARWLILTKERMNHRIQLERQEAHRMHELDMMKIKFFTNVSHEFRTPLTLILTPLEKILKQTEEGEQKNQFQLIHRNARRLLNLVNQLLDFRKMEVQEIKLNTSEGDVVQYIQDLTHSFSDLSEKKNIKFSFSTSIQHLETFFDQDKIEKILFNLLSNAFKFTPENGEVKVELNLKYILNDSYLEINVKDTGIGIPSDKHEKIFDRFFQHELPTTLVNQGSGIGLSITKEFVKLHGGQISVQSEVGEGSCFTVLIPVREIPHQVTVRVEKEISIEESVMNGTVHENAALPVVLLVEDNEDFRFYLKDNLRMQYSIIEASNGKEGFYRAVHSIPDLIVSDVMMPEMNGIEFCKRVKGDPRVSHIPVILLTARSSEEQKLEGFETGANDYITKPFSFEILQSRIRNLITEREKFHKVFQKHMDVKANDIKITSMDEKLIQNAIRIVEEHIGDPDFSVEGLSRELGMSRVHLYKKLLSITGKSPIEFIRTIRLQRAAQLLEKSQLTVSEVAYQVGFNNPKYFTKYFKDEFNILPSAYAAGKKISLG
jgi:signal transduction histidine kinase/ligand-binding sensor domain-containing protein/AraC-like DNA-binding protein